MKRPALLTFEGCHSEITDIMKERHHPSKRWSALPLAKDVKVILETEVVVVEEGLMGKRICHRGIGDMCWWWIWHFWGWLY